jgi:hypothetical protein
MGLVVMFVVSAVIGWVVSSWVGFIGGAIVGVLVFVGWYRLNYTSGTTGLFKANLKSYFSYRRRGLDVSGAIEGMIRSRYPFSRQKQDEALAVIRSIPTLDDEGVAVVQAILGVFCFEQGPPPTDELRRKFTVEIAALYEALAKRHRLPV